MNKNSEPLTTIVVELPNGRALVRNAVDGKVEWIDLRPGRSREPVLLFAARREN